MTENNQNKEKMATFKKEVQPVIVAKPMEFVPNGPTLWATNPEKRPAYVPFSQRPEIK